MYKTEGLLQKHVKKQQNLDEKQISAAKNNKKMTDLAIF